MKFFTGILVAGILPLHGSAKSDGTMVQTQQGVVSGALSAGVRRFLGIPFAVANRWEAPQPPSYRNTTLKATTFGDSCVQSLTAGNSEFLTLFGLGHQDVQESEDCLSVNIWAPSLERKQGAAVMLWIYGGGFAFGTSNTTYYEGQNIVENNDDILVVSFDYRLNIFGQPSAPQLMVASQSANFGLLDLKAAVEWVHSNIAAFGGDPERITLFGESAGSLAVDAYIYAYPTDTMVKGVIEESGSLAGNSLLAPQSNVTFMDSWNKIANVVGCGPEPTSQQFSCMKDVPLRTLEDAVFNERAPFGPVPDGITYFSDTTERSAAGNFLRVPLLIGNNAQEGDVFVVEVEELGLGSMIPGLTERGSEVVTQLTFVCPAGMTAGDHSRSGVPTWRYRYEGVFPDISSRPDLHAFHASEVPIVFGTYKSSLFPADPTRTERALSKYMQSAWVAFARDPTQGLSHFGWPKYNPSTLSLARLGSPLNASGVAFAPGAAFDTGCNPDEASLALAGQILGLLL